MNPRIEPMSPSFAGRKVGSTDTSSGDNEPHDRPCGAAARDFLKAGLPERGPVAHPIPAHVLGSLPPPVHAPAAAARPARPEQTDEVRPARRGEGTDDEPRRLGAPRR